MRSRYGVSVGLAVLVGMGACAPKKGPQTLKGAGFEAYRVVTFFDSSSPGVKAGKARMEYLQVRQATGDHKAEEAALGLVNLYLGPQSFLDRTPAELSNEFHNGAWPFDGVEVLDATARGDFLSVAYRIRGTGAGPWERIYGLTVNNRGEILDLEAVVGMEALEAVVAEAQETLDRLVEERVRRIPDAERSAPGISEAIETLQRAKVKIDALSFYMASDGALVFLVDYGLPQAFRALAPTETVRVPEAFWKAVQTGMGD